jgi:hypothetical protein
VPDVSYRSPPPERPAPPTAAVNPPVRQSAATPRTPTPRVRPKPPAPARETTASIPQSHTAGKSIPAPVAPSAARSSGAGEPANGDAAATAETPKTETQPVPVAPLL